MFSSAKKFKPMEVKMLLLLALTFSLAFLVTDSVFVWLEFLKFFPNLYRKINYDAVSFICILISRLLPLVVFMTWYMYIERYVYFRKQYYEEKFYSKGKRAEGSPDISMTVIVMILLEIAFFLQYLELKYYLAYNWNILDGLKGCSAIGIVLLFIWLISWIGSITLGKHFEIITSDNKRKMKTVKTFLILLLIFSLVFMGYSVWKAERVYVDKMSEHYQQSEEYFHRSNIPMG